MFRWTVHQEGGPRRSYHAAVAVGHQVYSFGGLWLSGMETYTGPIDVHVYNTESLRWRKLPPVTTRTGERSLEVPSMRWSHTAVLIENIIYIWGGANSEIDDGGLYAFDVDTHTWSKPSVSGTVPGARFSHSACVLGKVMYIFGGCEEEDLDGSTSSDLYKLDTTTMAWSLVMTGGTRAPYSSCHSATIIGRKIFVFGGQPDEDHYNNISVFDTETSCWMRVSDAQLPEGRMGHSAFAYNGELYIFGGDGGRPDPSFNYFWKFNPETLSWKKVEPMGNEEGLSGLYGMCCCKVGDRIILFGGYRCTPYDLHILDLSPSLKTLCKVAVTKYGLEQAGLPHDIKWELHREKTGSPQNSLRSRK